MERFEEAYAFTSKWEGGYSDYMEDRGGCTKYGISIVFLKDFEKRQAPFLWSLRIPTPVNKNTIKALTREQAKQIMKKEFWDPLQLEHFDNKLAIVMFDCAVHSGPVRSIKLAQQAYNNLNPDKKQLAVDGIMGPCTQYALIHCTKNLPVEHVALRNEYCHRIVRNDSTQGVFLGGWLNRLNDLMKLIIKDY